MRQERERQARTEDTQTAADEERILAPAGAVRPTRRVLLYDGEDVGADESANLAERGGDGVVLPANGGSAGLGGDETDVVARPGLAEAEEDPVHDDEAGDVGGLVEFAVGCCHDEADDALAEDTDTETEARADDVREESAADGAGEVEDVDDGVPAESLP